MPEGLIRDAELMCGGAGEDTDQRCDKNAQRCRQEHDEPCGGDWHVVDAALNIGKRKNRETEKEPHSGNETAERGARYHRASNVEGKGRALARPT